MVTISQRWLIIRVTWHRFNALPHYMQHGMQQLAAEPAALLSWRLAGIGGADAAGWPEGWAPGLSQRGGGGDSS